MKLNRDFLKTFMNKRKLLIIFTKFNNYCPHMPDDKYIRWIFKVRTGKKLNLKNPQTFNEKLQWLKLCCRKPEYTTMVDKYRVKKYVAEKIGKQYIIPTLGVWKNFDDIDFDKLPDKFVLKCNHNSGGLIICRNKSELDIKKARRIISRCLRKNFYLAGREWPYKNVKPLVIAEKFMKDSETSELRDYKFFCFDGKPVYCQVISDRTSCETMDFFDMEWKRQDFTKLSDSGKPFPPSKFPIPVPCTFEEMKEKAAVLSKGIPFVRVDFYEINKKMYFGELTFFPASGFGGFSPDVWDYKVGSFLKLPKKRR